MEARLVADNEHPSIPARRLAERLRDLRGHITQKQLAKALGGAAKLSDATISQWETPGSGRIPPQQRLEAYARLFCTGRSFTTGAPRLLRDDELDKQERERQAELYAELLALRERAMETQAGTSLEPITGPGSSIWHFPDGDAVSIVCSDAPAWPLNANPSHLNYTRYARHADLDALIEVFGQLRSDNPASMIRILSPDELVQDFALNHLVIIGGAAAKDVIETFPTDIPLPKAEEIPDTDTHLFRCTVGDETRELTSTRDDQGALVRDVGVIARGSHPLVPEHTVTVLSGITSRGVHGATLCFTDRRVGDANERYLKAKFGNTGTFCIAMNIPVRNNVALPPNLWREDVRLYEWSDETGAHW
jgi:transcriptional regulator with XRE-family HTH domain